MLIRRNHEMRLEREKYKNATLFSFVCVVSAFHCKEYLFSFLLALLATTARSLAYFKKGESVKKCSHCFNNRKAKNL